MRREDDRYQAHCASGANGRFWPKAAVSRKKEVARFAAGLAFPSEVHRVKLVSRLMAWPSYGGPDPPP
jgi:hypothetical protein